MGAPLSGRGGAPIHNLAKKSRTLHEIVRICIGGGGGGGGPRASQDPPMEFLWSQCIVNRMPRGSANFINVFAGTIVGVHLLVRADHRFLLLTKEVAGM